MRIRLPRRWGWLLLIPAFALGGWWWYARQAARSYILYLSGQHAQEEIYRMNGDGTGVRRIITGAPDTYYWQLAANRDGTRIAYMADFKIQLADINGAHRQQVPSGSEHAFAPSFFPDGRSLAYCSSRVTIGHLCRINLDGTGKRQLTFGQSYDDDPIVSPDGKYIVFGSGRRGDWDLYRIDADGGNMRHLIWNPTFSSPAISPDGRLIAFATYESGSGRGEIFLMDSHGRHLRRLTHETLGADAPAFSPDGKRIVYTISDNCYSDICVINLNGSGRKMLTNNWLRYTLRQRLGDGKVSRFLGLTGRFNVQSPVWVPAKQGGVVP